MSEVAGNHIDRAKAMEYLEERYAYGDRGAATVEDYIERLETALAARQKCFWCEACGAHADEPTA